MSGLTHSEALERLRVCRANQRDALTVQVTGDIVDALVAEPKIEEIAMELYAAGPWGRFDRFLDGGLRCSMDAHTMDFYRRITRMVLEVHTP